MGKLSQIVRKVKLNKTTIFALARSSGFCNTLVVVKAAQGKGNEVGASFDAAWEEVRADATIQFAPAPAPQPPEIPQWWRDFLDWLGELLRPLFEMLTAAWPILRILLLVMLAVGALTLLWIILAPYVEQWRGRKRSPDDVWQPQPEAARELLAQAEVLAAEGQFDQAVRLLLHHSIADIEKRRPDLLRPSNTAREIERFESLPQTAREMFAVIVGQVERGIFAALPIDENGWQVSRDAYAGFALKENWRSTGKG